MNHLGNRGQAGPLGEDMVSIIIAVLSISVILISLNNFFTNEFLDYDRINSYETGWLLADVIALRYSYNDSSNIYYPRLLDINKLCNECILKKDTPYLHDKGVI
ncbi:MAG: hypothetical protein DRO92_03235 [Candidatus Altiarchaeales archaeon]|nr:MAG: hypothetical protein DRO92_03235 [Candidatus Altiarchaeales archaeon]